MSKFKVGDKVVVLNTADTRLNKGYYRAGAMGTIVALSCDSILVEFLPNQNGVDYEDGVWYVDPDSLRKVDTPTKADASYHGKYLVAIGPGNGKCVWGAVFPDVPECFGTGSSLEEALTNAKEAIIIHLETLREEGGALSLNRTMEHHYQNPEYAGFLFTYVEV